MTELRVNTHKNGATNHSTTLPTLQIYDVILQQNLQNAFQTHVETIKYVKTSLPDINARVNLDTVATTVRQKVRNYLIMNLLKSVSIFIYRYNDV